MEIFVISAASSQTQVGIAENVVQWQEVVGSPPPHDGQRRDRPVLNFKKADRGLAAVSSSVTLLSMCVSICLSWAGRSLIWSVCKLQAGERGEDEGRSIICGCLGLQRLDPTRLGSNSREEMAP